MAKYGLMVVLLALLSGNVFSGSVSDADKYIDSVISQYLKPDLGGLDPKRMQDFNTAFRTSFSVTANYSHGDLEGLKTFKRLGDCKAPYWSFGNATLNCTMTFDKLTLKYDLKGQYGSLPKVNDARAHGLIQNSDIFIEVTTSPQRNFPFLKQFVVRSLGHFTPSFDHLGSLRFPKDTLAKTFAGNSSIFVIDVLNRDFLWKVGSSVSKLTMPMP